MAVDSWGHVDLFCGPGGFASGFEAAGFRTLVGLDIHGPSVATFRRNHPNATVIQGDIREVGVDRIRDAVGDREVRVITAGVPCEGFSMSNRNRGRFLDERNFLFIEFLRVAEAFRPPYIVLENVSALTRHEEGFFKGEIEKGMRDIGYDVKSRVLDALGFGVPQRRRRVFFVGRLQGWRFDWPEPTHGDAPGLTRPPTVWEAIGDLAPLGSDETTEEYGRGPLSEYAARLRGSALRVTNHHSPKHPPETVAKIAATAPGKPMYASFRQRIRLDPDRPSPTVVSGGIRPQFHYGHPTQPRGLTVRERARLQSFPDSYYFEGGIVQGRVQTGDAVPPLLARAMARQIAAGLQAGADADTSSEVGEIGAVELFPLAGRG